MGQNFAAQVASLFGGGTGFLNLDASGALKVVQAESPTVTLTPINASSGNVAAASAVATLAAAAGKTTYIAGLSVTGAGATAASVVSLTLTGLIGGTMTFNVPVPAGVSVALGEPINLQFNPPLPASAVNTAIVATLPSLGAGNANAAVNAWGYQK